VFEEEMAFARDLADHAAQIGLSVFAGDVQVSIKADRTPVTQADTSIEAMIRSRIAEAYPDDHVLGEEEGGDALTRKRLWPKRLWIVDPIDATANFARAIPVWATLIALQQDGDTILAIVEAPALRERYEAVKGQGATLNGAPIRVSGTADTAEAQILYAGLEAWLKTPTGKGVLSVLADAKRTRGFGDFWGHALVARGAAEAMIEPSLALWDYAAPTLIVEEAGGRVTTMEGAPLHHGGSVLSSNGVIHDELLRRFAGNS
jgi:histidinol-phosphatase